MTVNESNKKELPAIVRIPKNIIQFLIFLLIQILLIPVFIIAMVPLIYKDLVTSRSLGVSSTALEPVFRRWQYHYFRAREDEVTIKLVKALPTASHFGMMGVMAAMLIANRICGFTISMYSRVPEPGKENLVSMMLSRTEFFDRLMEKHLPSMDQVVLLGAGFDSRSFKFCQGRPVKVFELDEGRTQQMKIEAQEKAGLKHEWITFVPVDFEQAVWIEKLVESGFDPSKKTFFLWEGVTYYLTEETVRQTLKIVGTSSGKGSVITFDYFSKELVSGTIAKSMKVHADAASGFHFSIDHEQNPRETVESLLIEAGLSVGEINLMGEGGKLGGLVEAVNL